MTVAFGPERDLLVRVLRLWIRRRSTATIESDKALTKGLAPLKMANDWGLSRLQKADLPVAMDRETEGFLFGPSVTHRGATFQPVASVQLTEENGHLQACLRVAAYHLDLRGALAADGWRFESGEVTNNAPHPWAHVQRTTRWHKEDQTLLDPLLTQAESAAGGPEAAADCPHIVNESRPAIPLGCASPAGLALTMIGSLHGGPFVQDLIDTDVKLKQALHREDGAALLLQL